MDSLMADTNFRNSNRKIDDALDAALDATTQGVSQRPTDEVPLKRQWDADLEAELEAALEGFDAAKFDVATPRSQAAGDRKKLAGGERGQESRSGPQTGKVIAIRGKSIFVDLGAKS